MKAPRSKNMVKWHLWTYAYAYAYAYASPVSYALTGTTRCYKPAASLPDVLHKVPGRIETMGDSWYDSEKAAVKLIIA